MAEVQAEFCSNLRIYAFMPQKYEQKLICALIIGNKKIRAWQRIKTALGSS